MGASFTVPSPAQASKVAALFSVLSKQRYLALAVPHNLAVELRSSQMADAYRNGTFPKAGWRSESEARALNGLVELREKLRASFFCAFGLALFALAVAVFMGKVHPSLPFDYGKVVSSAGGTLTAWAGLLQLSPVCQTYVGSTLHEVVYSTAIKTLALVGVLLAAIGALWWQ